MVKDKSTSEAQETAFNGIAFCAVIYCSKRIAVVCRSCLRGAGLYWTSNPLFLISAFSFATPLIGMAFFNDKKLYPKKRTNHHIFSSIARAFSYGSENYSISSGGDNTSASAPNLKKVELHLLGTLRSAGNGHYDDGNCRNCLIGSIIDSIIIKRDPFPCYLRIIYSDPFGRHWEVSRGIS